MRINARFARRGRKLLAAPRVVVRDPFGLACARPSGRAQDAELLVLPRIEPVVAIPPGGDGAGIAGAGRARPHIAAEVDLDGLRQLRPGTPASRIFWPSLARGAGMMERRLRAESDTRPLVLLDPRGAAREEDLDAAVRAAASLTVHLAKSGGCALLLPGDRRPVILEPTLGGWPHAHARLALVEGTARPSLAALAGRRGPVLYVAARRVHRSPRALANAPGGGPDPGRPRRARRAPAVVRGRRLPRLRAVGRPRGARAEGARLVAAAAAPRIPAAGPRAGAAAIARRDARSGWPRSRCWRRSPASAWGTNLLAPSGAGRAVLMALIAAALGAALLALGAVAPAAAAPRGGARSPSLLALAFVLEACGVGARLLVPTAWGDLASGISQGIGSLPSANVPYDGADEWVRITILAGAGGLVLLAAGLAFWPRAAHARPTAAAVALGVALRRAGRRAQLRAPLALRRGVRAAADGVPVGRAPASASRPGSPPRWSRWRWRPGCCSAPRVDGAQPLLDPQHLADPLAGPRRRLHAGTTSTARSTWPRDGREVLRVKAQTAAYWKAVNLVEFDGVRWRGQAVIDPNARDTEFAAGEPQWHADDHRDRARPAVLRVRRGGHRRADHRHGQAARAQLAGNVRHGPQPAACPATPTACGSTRRGPARAQLASAGTHYPDDFTSDDLAMALPASVGGPPVRNPFNGRVSGRYAMEITFPTFGEHVPALAQTPTNEVTRRGSRLAARLGLRARVRARPAARGRLVLAV